LVMVGADGTVHTEVNNDQPPCYISCSILYRPTTIPWLLLL